MMSERTQHNLAELAQTDPDQHHVLVGLLRIAFEHYFPPNTVNWEDFLRGYEQGLLTISVDQDDYNTSIKLLVWDWGKHEFVSMDDEMSNEFKTTVQSILN